MSEGNDSQGTFRLADGGEIAYQVSGLRHRNTPLLLLRPLGGTMALWGPFRDELEKHFRVIAFDYRGQGYSRNEPRVVTTTGLAIDAVALFDHLNIERAHVFGVSLGGMVATSLASLAPERIASLCLASTPARGIEVSFNGIRRELALAACLAQPRSRVETKMIARLLSSQFRKAHPERVLKIQEIVRSEPQSSRTVLAKYALAAAMHDARSKLSTLAMPALVLAGEHDRLLGSAPIRALADALPCATYQVIRGAGHALTLEKPHATAARVCEFLQS